jgi:hypothetical protein
MGLTVAVVPVLVKVSVSVVGLVVVEVVTIVFAAMLS